LLKLKADTQHSNTIINGISRIGFTTGGKTAWWKDENISFVLLDKTDSFLKENKSKPFFLYLAYTDIHVPRMPNARFKNKSTMGSRGDAIVQMDWLTGQVMKKLDEFKLSNNTLVIFTSDNGPILDDGYDDKAEELVGSHKPAGPFRGGKYSAFEGGTRVPTIVYWPSKIKPGKSHALVSQVDLFASLAKLTGQTLGPDEAPDSFDMLSALLDQTKKGRSTMLEEAYTLALRDGDWKYIAPQTIATPNWMVNKNIEGGLSSVPQLYNLKKDISESQNLADSYPEQIKKMQQILKAIQANATRPAYQK
jgi:arylsulfatase A-like enzyme